MHEHIEELYVSYYYDLFAFLMKQCPDRHIIDDLIQNTFLEALKSIDKFEGKSSIKTWLFSIAKFELYRYYRKNKPQLNIDQLPEKDLTAKADFADGLMAEEILNSINKLPPPQDEIMRLRLVHGLSFKEIGLKINRSENYCRVNFYRIKERLREVYRDE